MKSKRKRITKENTRKLFTLETKLVNENGKTFIYASIASVVFKWELKKIDD